MTCLNRVRARQPHQLEYELASGQVLRVGYAPTAGDGPVLTYADITARRKAEQPLARKEAELHVCLDNTPGALIFTDENLARNRKACC